MGRCEQEIIYPLIFAFYFSVPFYQNESSHVNDCLEEFRTNSPDSHENAILLIREFSECIIGSAKLYNRSISLSDPINGRYLHIKFKKPEEKDREFLGILLWDKLKENLQNEKEYPYPHVRGYYRLNLSRMYEVFPEGIIDELKKNLTNKMPLETSGEVLAQIFETDRLYFDYASLNVSNRNDYLSDEHLRQTSRFLGQAFSKGVVFNEISSLFHSSHSHYIGAPFAFYLAHFILLQGIVKENQQKYPNVSLASFLRDPDNVLVDNDELESTLLEKFRYTTPPPSFNYDQKLFTRCQFNSMFENGLMLSASFYPWFLAGFLSISLDSDIMTFFREYFIETDSPRGERYRSDLRNFLQTHPQFLPSRPRNFLHVVCNGESDSPQQKTLYMGIVTSFIMILHSNGYRVAFGKEGELEVDSPVTTGSLNQRNEMEVKMGVVHLPQTHSVKQSHLFSMYC